MEAPAPELFHFPPPVCELFPAPPRTDTGAPVRHANTYSDVGDHVAFGVDPPCDRQFFLSCRLLSARLLDRGESV